MLSVLITVPFEFSGKPPQLFDHLETNPFHHLVTPGRGMEPKVTIHRYYSRQAKYEGAVEADLELCIKHCGGDVVRIELVNRLHGIQLQRKLRRLLLLMFLSIAYFVGTCGFDNRTISFLQPRILYPLITCASVAILLIRSTLNLVQAERLFYSWDMALQMETVRSFGRESVLCVQRGHIEDIVLNEVIEDVRTIADRHTLRIQVLMFLIFIHFVSLSVGRKVHAYITYKRKSIQEAPYNTPIQCEFTFVHVNVCI